jgi:hypothetical protein
MKTMFIEYSVRMVLPFLLKKKLKMTIGGIKIFSQDSLVITKLTREK